MKKLYLNIYLSVVLVMLVLWIYTVLQIHWLNVHDQATAEEFIRLTNRCSFLITATAIINVIYQIKAFFNYKKSLQEMSNIYDKSIKDITMSYSDNLNRIQKQYSEHSKSSQN